MLGRVLESVKGCVRGGTTECLRGCVSECRYDIEVVICDDWHYLRPWDMMGMIVCSHRSYPHFVGWLLMLPVPPTTCRCCCF